MHPETETAGNFLTRLIAKHPEEKIASLAAMIGKKYGIPGGVMEKITEKVSSTTGNVVEKGAEVVTRNAKAVKGSIEERMAKIFSANPVLERNGKEGYKNWAWEKRPEGEKKELTDWAKKFENTLNEWKKEKGGDISQKSAGVSEELAQNASKFQN